MRGMIAADDVIASLPKERQKKIAARGNELLAKVQRRMTLSEIRKGRKISQAKIAEALGIGQMQISRLEKRMTHGFPPCSAPSLRWEAI